MSADGPKKLPQYLIALLATFGGFTFGVAFSWTSPASASLRDGSYLDGRRVTAGEEAWIGALVPLGAAFSCTVAGLLMDRVGRRTALLLLCGPMALGWALLIWATGVEMLYAGRFIIGLAGGSYGVVIPAFTAEVAEKEVRGALGGYYETLLVFGILVVYGLGIALPLFHLSLICGVFPLLYAVICYFLPETPLYHILKDREPEACKTLHMLRGDHFDIEPELEEIRERVRRSQAAQLAPGGLLRAFKGKAAREGLLMSLGLMLCQQLCGVNAIVFYTSSIFKEAHSDLDPDVAALIIGVLQFVGAFTSTLLVDRWGRRALLLVSSGCTLASNVALAAVFYMQDSREDVSSVSWLPLVSLAFYIFTYELGLGPIPFMIIGELFVPDVIGKAGGVSVFTSWILVFLVTKFYSDLVVSFGAGVTFIIFTAFSALGILYVHFFVQETKGKTIEEIQLQLEGKKR